MSRPLKAAILVVLVAVGLLVLGGIYRAVKPSSRGLAALTPMPGASGFEPTNRPVGPVLRNTTPGSLSVAFAYTVGGVAYDYGVAFSFAPGAEQGRATVTARHDGHDASTDSVAVRRWDEPRKAFAVALSDKFMISPPVPSLCMKAVVGPNLARYDLGDSTLCVAQRDTGGACHPETLACGLLRP